MEIQNILNTTLLWLFFGTFGTTIGGILGVTFKGNSARFLSFVLQFAAGLMLAVICFDLIPEALDISNMFNLIIGIMFGVILMIFCDNSWLKKSVIFLNKFIDKRTNIL